MAIAVAVALVLVSAGCRKKVGTKECDQLLDRFAELAAKEEHPDAGPEQVKEDRAKFREAAKISDEFKSCPSEVEPHEFACAMKAPTSQAMIKCLE
jgi:hypothetical protein